MNGTLTVWNLYADRLADRPWRRGLVRTVIAAMVARRGEPGWTNRPHWLLGADQG